MITPKRCKIRKSKRDLEYSPKIPRWLDRLSGTVSRRGYQTLILKGRVKFTTNSFNLQCFSPQLSLWRTMMILTRQPTQTVTLIMLVFVISGTQGYRLGLEIINATSCGKLLFSNLTLKNSLGKITECYQKWHGNWKLGIPLEKGIVEFLFNNWLTTFAMSESWNIESTTHYPCAILRLRHFVVRNFHCHEAFLCSKLTSFLYYMLGYLSSELIFCYR